MKKTPIISLFAGCLGAIQMYWFLPNGLSCFDVKSGVIEAIEILIPIQFIITSLICKLFQKRARFYVLLPFLCVFWFLINKHEFTYRHACWSTYFECEILFYTLYESIVPITVCLSVFSVGYLIFCRV